MALRWMQLFVRNQQRGIKFWNSLADDVKQSFSLKTFTNKLNFNLLNDIN